MSIRRGGKMEEQDKWINGLRNKLRDHSEPIPTGAWEELERELKGDEQNATSKVIPLWRRWQSVAAVVAILVLSATTLLFWESVSNDPLKQQAQVIEKEYLDVKEEVPESELAMAHLGMKNSESDRLLMENLQKDGVGVGSTLPPKKSRLLSLNSNETSAGDELKRRESLEEKEIVTTQTLEGTNDQAGDLNPKEDIQRVQAEPNRMRRKEFFANSKPTSKKREEKRTTFVLAMGNMSTAVREEYRGYTRLLMDEANALKNNAPESGGGIAVFPNYEKGTTEHAISTLVLNNIANNNVVTNVRHQVPVTFGASVRFQLNKYWGLETGLTYTFLRSEWREGSDENYREQQQRLHYLGIPLKATRTIWSNRYFEFYASAGGAIEKSVSGELKTNIVINKEENVTNSTSLNVKEFQWSLAAAAGAQYKITNQIGFYVEPGMVYYFNDGSSVETIRKDRPFNFNLQFGFRIDF
ncbi:MAG: porin family protein [Phocaeicola sp.]